METKQGYFDPKLPFPLDIRYYKATKAEILAIPLGARYEGMEIYAYSERLYYIFKNGTADANLVVSRRQSEGLSTPVTNVTGTDIARHKVVYVAGDANNLPACDVADNTDVNKQGTGITVTEVVNNGEGVVVFDGIVRYIDTSAWATSDALYYDSNGDLTNVKPVVGYDGTIGEVLVGGSVEGMVFFDFATITEGGGGGGPAVENRYVDLTTMIGDQINQTNGGLQYVDDASADPQIVTGYAYYEYLGTTVGDLTDYRLVATGAGGSALEDGRGTTVRDGNKVDIGGGDPVGTSTISLDQAGNDFIIEEPLQDVNKFAARLRLSDGYGFQLRRRNQGVTSGNNRIFLVEAWDDPVQGESLDLFAGDFINGPRAGFRLRPNGTINIGDVWSNGDTGLFYGMAYRGDYASIDWDANDLLIPHQKRVQALIEALTGPAIENRYADISALIADQSNQTDRGLQYVADASADANVDNGYAYYEYLGTTVGDLTDYRLVAQENAGGGGGEVVEEITIDEASKTNAIAMNADTTTLIISLAADLTSDAKPSGWTGWVTGRNYQIQFIKKGTYGFDGSDALAANNIGYDDDIDPFVNLIDIDNTQQRAVMSAAGFVSYGQMGRMIITGSNYAEP